jgi:cell division protein FtsL
MNEDNEKLTILLLCMLAIILGLLIVNQYTAYETRKAFFHKDNVVTEKENTSK